MWDAGIVSLYAKCCSLYQEFEESGDPEHHFQELLSLARHGIEKGKVCDSTMYARPNLNIITNVKSETYISLSFIDITATKQATSLNIERSAILLRSICLFL